MIIDKFKIPKKTAIVTGAMGGNGFAIANALAEAGAKLILTDIKENNSMFDELKSKNYSFSFIEGDVSNSDFPNELINFTLDGGCKLVGPEINVTFAPDLESSLAIS